MPIKTTLANTRNYVKLYGNTTYDEFRMIYNNMEALLSLATKVPVKAATTANLAQLYGPQTVDGVSLVADDRVLVKDQTDATKNGVYDVNNGFWGRSLDWDDLGSEVDVVTGTRTTVDAGGTANGETAWIVTNVGVIVLGTTALTFTDDTTTPAAKEVTLGMLADGTAGELITYDVSGVAAKVAVGIAAQVLTSNGVGIEPTFQAIPASGATEGVDLLSTGEGGGALFLREDGDGTSSWQAVPAGGDVTKVGTPVDNEIAVWTGDGTLEGDTNFTWDGINFSSIGAILSANSGVLGVAAQYVISHALDTQSILMHGGTVGNGGGLLLVGGTGASAGDWILQTGSQSVIFYDRSSGGVRINSGPGTVAAAIDINSSQLVTIFKEMNIGNNTEATPFLHLSGHSGSSPKIEWMQNNSMRGRIQYNEGGAIDDFRIESDSIRANISINPGLGSLSVEGKLSVVDTALVSGDFTLSGGFGSTASVGTILGNDQRCSFIVTSAGTGQGANPTITLTFTDEAWVTAPIAVACRTIGSQITVQPTVTSISTTTLVLTFQGTPIAAETYGFSVILLG